MVVLINLSCEKVIRLRPAKKLTKLTEVPNTHTKSVIAVQTKGLPVVRSFDLPTITRKDKMNFSLFKNETMIRYPLEHRSSTEVMAETSIGCILFLVGVTGNSLVCYVIHKKRFTNSSMYYFMLNLAYADLLVCFVSIPLTLLSTRPKPLLVTFGSVPCKILRFIQYILPPASVAILTATAIDRYFHICVPLKKMITTKATKQLAAVCWCAALILTLPIFYLIETQKVTYDGSIYEFCNIEETSAYPKAGKAYLVIRGGLGFAIPLALICVLYFKIVRTVWQRHSRHRSANRQRANVVKSLLTVVIAFSLSWAPFSICNKYYLFMKPERQLITRQEIICFWIGLTASVYNPLIYAFYNKKFRNAFVSVILKKKPNVALKQAQSSCRPRSKTLPALLSVDNERQITRNELKRPVLPLLAETNILHKKTRHLSLAFDLKENSPKFTLTNINKTNPSYAESQRSLDDYDLPLNTGFKKQTVNNASDPYAKEARLKEDFFEPPRIVESKDDEENLPRKSLHTEHIALKRSKSLKSVPHSPCATSMTQASPGPVYTTDRAVSRHERNLLAYTTRYQDRGENYQGVCRSKSFTITASYNLCSLNSY